VDAVDYDAVVERIVDAARVRRELLVSAMAVHGVMTAAGDPVHRHRAHELRRRYVYRNPAFVVLLTPRAPGLHRPALSAPLPPGPEIRYG
jgi:hypothetical protein